MKRLLLNIGRLSFILFVVGTPHMGSSQPSEYLLKAVFFEKLARFIEWPDDKEKHNSNHFVIGIAGEDPFEKQLSAIYAEHKIKNRDVKIKYLQSPDDVDDCHLVFLSNSKKYPVKSILKSVKNRPILTVSDSDELSGSGVLVNLLLKGKHIGLEIDESAVNQSGLQISYLLLKEAKIIHPIGQKSK